MLNLSLCPCSTFMAYKSQIIVFQFLYLFDCASHLLKVCWLVQDFYFVNLVVYKSDITCSKMLYFADY